MLLLDRAGGGGGGGGSGQGGAHTGSACTAGRGILSHRDLRLLVRCVWNNSITE